MLSFVTYKCKIFNINSDICMTLNLNNLISIISSPEAHAKDSDFIHLFRHQAESNNAYAAYLKETGVKTNEITDWKDIPALPTDAFKSSSNPAAFDLLEHDVTTFLTSGTTTEVRGAHHFRSTTLYENSIISGWQSLKIPELHPNTLFLTPSAEEAPQSSLAHMMQTLKTNTCPNAQFILSEGTLDIESFRAAAQSGTPLSLIGTALAFLQLFENLAEQGEKFTLATGSWAMETGGYKGTNKSLTKEQLYALFFQYLGLAEEDIWNEYSMTELSSQFYTRGIGTPHQGPYWTRIKVINPETLQSVQPGEMGYLVIYDLANYDSCLAIMTQDLAIYHDQRSFTLIGRDPSALPRGCSRSL